jgi:hypothetical protein
VRDLVPYLKKDENVDWREFWIFSDWHFWARPSFKKNSDQIEKKN